MLAAVVVIKIFLVGFTVVSGGSAGLLVPAMFVGAMSSSALFHLLMALNWLPIIDGLHAIFGDWRSLIADLRVRSPIATVIFVGELFGVTYIPHVLFQLQSPAVSPLY